MKISIAYDDQQMSSLTPEEKNFRFQLVPPKGAGGFRIHLSFPLVDIHGVWCSWQSHMGAEPSAVLPWTFDLVCGAQKNAPIVSFLNLQGRNRCTIALTDLWDDMCFHGAINQENCCYEVTITGTLSAETLPFLLYVSQADSTLPEQVASWREQLALPPVQENAAAWEPVFCTWYAVHGTVDQEWVEANMPLAVSLGFKTLIVDDGWSYPEKKRVSPKTIAHWYEHVADWTVDQGKFPSFGEHVRKIQALGMKYLLWVAPPLLGENSHFLKQMPDAALPGNPTEGYCRLDVRNAAATEKLQESLQTLVKTWGLDGLKIDFLDIVEPSVEHPSGRPTFAFIRSLTEKIRAVKPDALLEYRQSYATPATWNCATQFRATDAPFDFLLNFSRIIQVRLLMGDGVPVHADPAYWNPEDSDVNIARHMIAMLGGVPMLSVTLTTLPERHRKIISFWMKFYKEHQRCLNFGHWYFDIVPGRIFSAAVSDATENIVIVRESCRMPEIQASDKPTYLLNLADSPVQMPGLACCWGPDGTPEEASAVPCGGCGYLKR